MGYHMFGQRAGSPTKLAKFRFVQPGLLFERLREAERGKSCAQWLRHFTNVYFSEHRMPKPSS